jgi:AraC-like DNA-binding protein
VLHAADAAGDPADAHLTVGQIAAQWGIYDGAHFSRIFRNAYGSSPREYRRSQLDTSVA